MPRTRLFYALIGALFAAVLAVATAPAAHAEAWRNLNPLAKRQPVRLASEGVSVELVPQIETHEADGETFEQASMRIAVTFPGRPPFVLPADEETLAHHGLGIGIARWARGDAQPAVLVVGFTGGMHCCVTTRIVTLGPAGPQVTTLPPADAAPETRLPRDVDGDGVRDLVRSDDRFLYAFTSYNASWPPPQIWNLAGGTLVDVSDAPRYAPLFRRFARRAWTECREGRPGACAGYAAAEARLGNGEPALARAIAAAGTSDWLPEPCTVPLVEDACPDGYERRFADYAEALRWFLGEHGYLR